MENDKQIRISAAGSRKATQWPVQQLWWSEFVERLRVPSRSTETLAEYLKLPKSQQDTLKDVGGYVGGTLAGGRRKAVAVTSRDLITLDLDHIPAAGTQDALKAVDGLGCAYVVYSTRKHSEATPRLRVVLPTARTLTVDEYEPCARKLADLIGIQMCDPSTFEASRLMYWPSCSSDSQYVYEYGDKLFIDPDGLLALYDDWQDITSWPQVPGVAARQQQRAARQEEPTAKRGVVGAFCRQYDVRHAIEELIPGVYEPCGAGQDRYTFTGGSTTGGAVVYDDGAFLYSHHATDPCSGQLVNAFDLVRLHKYGDLDDDAAPGTPTARMPSYTAMQQYARELPCVKTAMAQERYDAALEAFDGVLNEDNRDWVQQMTYGRNGLPEKTIDNVLVILRNDPNLRGKITLDEFSARGMATGALPWDSRTGQRVWSDNDDAGTQWYVERIHGITGKEKVLNALSLYANENRYNSVQDYLAGLHWDGVKRLDTLLIDYLGAEDTAYTRAVMRKSLAAAVARAMEPGIKYDTMPILAGPQGIGKSTFLRLLGKHWFSDSLQSFEGKEASEMIQGTWINELGELNGMTRSEINAVKQFLSRTEDLYRVPYGRHTTVYPRRCVFFGTTNDSEFLRDKTGNRRFWPVDVGKSKANKSVFDDLPREVDQIWAEALARWQLGEQLYLSGEAKRTGREQQRQHEVSNAKEGLIQEYLDRLIPVDWYTRSMSVRRQVMQGALKTDGCEMRQRTQVCALEIWVECLGGDPRFLKQQDTREINDILNHLEDWERDPAIRRFGDGYGRQRGFKRVEHSMEHLEQMEHISKL